MGKKRENQNLENTRRRPAQTRAIRESRGVKRYLYQSKPLAPRLLRLARAITAVPGHSQLAGISHVECEEMLAFYADSEKRGENVRALYPAVWKHLQACPRCRAAYTILMETTADDSTIPEVTSAHPLPFLVAQPEDAAWHTRVRSRIGGAPLGFGFTIRAEHLQKLVAPPESALILREQSPRADRSLLLSDTVTLGKREVIVQVWTRRTADPTRGQIEITLAASAPLPEPLRVSIAWNAHQYASQIQNGCARIDDIPLDELATARDLRVDFEERA